MVDNVVCCTDQLRDFIDRMLFHKRFSSERELRNGIQLIACWFDPVQSHSMTRWKRKCFKNSARQLRHFIPSFCPSLEQQLKNTSLRMLDPGGEGCTFCRSRSRITNGHDMPSHKTGTFNSIHAERNFMKFLYRIVSLNFFVAKFWLKSERNKGHSK